MIKKMFGAVLQKVLHDTRAVEYEQSVLRNFLKIIAHDRSKDGVLLKTKTKLINYSAKLVSDTSSFLNNLPDNPIRPNRFAIAGQSDRARHPYRID